MDMKHLELYIGLFFILISCNKDSEPKFITQNSNEIVKYVINISNMRITDYSKYINDKLIETTSFENTDTTIVRLTKNSENKITYKRVFIVGNTNLAKLAIDSSYSKDGLYTAHLDYVYENGYLIETTIDWNRFDDNPSSGQFYITRIIENENLKSSNEAYPGWPSGCTDCFDYNSTINKIDVIDFSNGITGNISKNLIKHASWHNGCPGGPSSSIACSDFKYELDNNGYIVKKTETYTPPYNMTLSDEVTRTVKTTIYEYNAR
ncbi:hypothetical protein CYCD_11640 [Tenuifilaceae bacterium CYCD]|nr:hypothetical protein CYCD_11640 [Tenuifilaceae bacterium CYCD]